MPGDPSAQGGEELQAHARQRVHEATAAFQDGDGEATPAAPDGAGELRALVEAAWEDTGRSAPPRGENYWDAGVTSLQIALFSETLGDRIGSDVEFNEVLEHPETGDLADHLHQRGKRGE